MRRMMQTDARVVQLRSRARIRKQAVVSGLRAGLVLAACALVSAVLGLTPSLRWISEIPLLAIFGAVPIAILGVAGYRAARATRQILAGLVSGAVAGAIGGAVSGAAYVAYGKPALNIAIGLAFGLGGGVVMGAIGAAAARRRS
jgi:hypothetical protein